MVLVSTSSDLCSEPISAHRVQTGCELDASPLGIPLFLALASPISRMVMFPDSRSPGSSCQYGSRRPVLSPTVHDQDDRHRTQNHRTRAPATHRDRKFRHYAASVHTLFSGISC
ncbi:hypothetical protein FRC08_003793 [Ceratobasidium sp. 394]|nr:hypothetical protein FRC08_003793 [Ceratobasidium sp. 394]KAG9086488.1 hypothetical protein FS749_003613 [Ceratobasidium sp. UAMH 11750]